MADTDPPHKVDDGEAPGYRDGNGPNADALQKEPGDGDRKQRDPAACDHEPAPPAQRRMAGQHDARELLGNRLESVPRRYHPAFPSDRIQHRIVYWYISGCHIPFNLLTVSSS